ncbi:AAA family ATPase [Acidisphaera sp. L21]|uniref:AAA family ATPase n=1 Tax=Acidisphaera sp. L21 TaxID=1641851 RepID=UPI00131E0FEA|nr:AAA family ATPase [Acidisphaera sp. L21]
MAIQFARARYISRSSGGSAVRSAAYNAREAIEAERTGEVFYFRHRDRPEHHEVLLPEGVPEQFARAGELWNAAEAAERRKDAQVAREIVLALPADREVTTEDRVAMARAFAQEHFVSKGLAVQLDVHAPHGAEAESERANWHAHLLITTRRIDRDGLNAKKARDLEPAVRQAGERPRVADGAVWGELWRDHQDQYFREHGIEARVDRPATLSQGHIGPVRMRRTGSEIVERAETIRQANEEAARDPEKVLAALTRNNATFTERDLDRFLTKQLGREGREGREEIAAIRAAVLKSPNLMPLYDRETGTVSDRYTTREVREQERAAMAAAGGLYRQKAGAVSARSAKAAMAARTLRPDQAEAFEHAIGAGHLKLIEGRAGTGKSYTLAAIRDAYERDGKHVVGLAPTNAVAQDLAQDGFREARTVHAALFAIKNGRADWDRHTVVVVDEAAMLDTRVTGELLDVARQAGAKVILAGDDRQLASIERGGLFAEMRQRHGSAEITEVTRQRVDWQRQAARDLAEGRFAEAVGAFDRAGAITWTDKQDEARSALVAAWKRDADEQPGQSRFVFAYTNRDVDALNAELRQVRRDRGELVGQDVQLDTKHGRAAFAVGDRVQFTDTDKKLRIYNGNVGTITRLDPSTGEITARLDAAGKDGREVRWSAADFEGFRHGYAGTIYKGQGKTLDRTYLYHTEHWRSAASYVALTRQRESAEVFVARETARDAGQLAQQMGRGEVRAASIAWQTRDELTQEQKREAEREERGQKLRDVLTDSARQGGTLDQVRGLLSPAGREFLDALHGKVDREFQGTDAERDKLKLHGARRLAEKEVRGGPVDPAYVRRQTAAWEARAQEKERGAEQAREAAHTPAPLLPAWRDPIGQGRDSLGRGTSPEELAQVASQAPGAVREVEAQKSYLQGAYRDPDQAGDALDKLIERSGRDLRVAARTLREDGPEVLGTLRGREGWLASSTAQNDRTRARSAAAAIGGSLDREAAARDAAVRHHTGEVEQQRARDAIEVPGLSKEALDTLKAVQMARLTAEIPREGDRYDARQRRKEELVSAAWREGRADPRVAHELDGFMAAASQRLGEEGMRNASRAATSGRRMTVPGVGREHQAGLDELARSFTQAREGMSLSKDWGRRVEREAKETEKWQARQEERERRGLARELEPDRERHRQERGLGSGR